MRKKTVKEIKEKMRSTPTVEKEILGLSSGSTLLNLACSNHKDVCYLPGHFFFLVGDSASGKTFLSLTCLAEAALNSTFKDYRFIYDNSENGALMDLEQFFGSAVAEKIEPPSTSKEDGQPVFSSTIEEFYFFIDDAIKENKPFIYILDSMDSLGTDEEIEKFQEKKLAKEKNKSVSGSYGTSKAKANSSNLRRIIHDLKKTNSILIIISQTRDNLGFGFEKKTRSGGRALRFYACVEIWSSVINKIKKTVLDKARTIGVNIQLQLKKNRISGRETSVELPIYYRTGFDDLGSCINYLVDEGHWKSTKGRINAEDFNVVLTQEKLIEFIEENNKEEEIRSLVQSVWNKIEEACEVKRKRKYL